MCSNLCDTELQNKTTRLKIKFQNLSKMYLSYLDVLLQHDLSIGKQVLCRESIRTIKVYLITGGIIKLYTFTMKTKHRFVEIAWEGGNKSYQMHPNDVSNDG